MRALSTRLQSGRPAPRWVTSVGYRPHRRTALSIAFCLLAAANARGVPLDEVPIGTSHLNVESAEFLGGGEEVTYLVIDFRAAGGSSFAFGYRHDGMATALDMLETFATAGVLEIAYEDFSFGPAVRGIGYPGEKQEDVFPGAFDGPRSWVLWDGVYEDQRVAWSDAQVGINGVEFGNTEPTVFLPDGGFYGLSSWWADDYPGPPPQVPLRAAIPEPASLVLIVVCLVGAGARCVARNRVFGRTRPA